MVCYAKLAQLVFALQILARTAKVQFLIYSQLASKNRALLSQNSQTQIKTNKTHFTLFAMTDKFCLQQHCNTQK